MTRGDVLFVVIVTMIGGIVRFVGLTDIGLTHYDEGVYVLWAGAGGFPAKELFAPPLFPLILRTVFAVTGPSDVAALGVSAAFGTVSIPLVWWIAYRWYGPIAASASAVMAAASGFDVAFSKMALTDSCFKFWFLVAIALASVLFDSCSASKVQRVTSTPLRSLPRRWFLAILLGIVIGLAWNTKYNGALLVPIVGAPLVVALFWRGRNGDFDWRRAALFWCVAVVVATLLYLPWFLHVNRSLESGYAELLAHQRGYSTELAGWPSNFVTMVTNHWCITTWIGRLGPCLAAAVSIGRWRGRGCWTVVSELGIVVSLGSWSLLLGDAIAWIIGLPFVLLCLRDRTTGTALLAAWLVVFFILTPLYRPYARLVLPLTAAGWIATGGAIQWLFRAAATASDRRWPLASCALTLLAMGGFGYALLIPETLTPVPDVGEREPRPNGSAGWESRVRSVRLDGPVASFVRPSVLFYLIKEWQVAPVADLSFLERAGPDVTPKFLCVDFALLRDNPDATDQLAKARDRLTVVARWEYAVSAATLLDDFGRACIRSELRSPEVGDGISTPYRPDSSHVYYASPLASGGSPAAYPYQVVLYRVHSKSE